MKKALLFLLALSLLVIPVFANGGSDTPKENEKSQLSIIWWGSQDRHNRTIKVIELYMENNPNVEITYEFSGWNDYWTKVTTMAAGGMLPDIMQQDYSQLYNWKSKNLLDSWDSSIDAGLIDLSDVGDSALSGGRIDGKLYGINLGMNSQCIIMDLDAFEKAGIDVPPQNWTWDEFEALSKKIYDKQGIYSIISLYSQQQWKSLYLANGEWAYSDDGKSLGYTDDSLYVNFLKMIKRLTEYGAYPTRDIEIADYGKGDNSEQQPIITKEAAMAYTWSNLITAISSAAGDDRRFYMTHLPRLKSDGPASNFLKPSMFFSLTTNSRNPDEAARFVNFFTNNLEANKILMADRGVPISSKIQDGLAPLLGEPARMAFEYIGRVAQDCSPVPEPDPVGHQEIMNDVFVPRVIDPIAFGEISAEEGVALLRTEAEKILKNN